MSKLLIFGIAVVLSASLQAQAPEYAKGDIVRLAPQASGEPLPDSRVIAAPGDRIQVNKSGIMVNGEPLKDVSAPMVAQLATEPWDRVVPDEHFVVIGERHDSSGAVRYHGLIPAAKIVRKISK